MSVGPHAGAGLGRISGLCAWACALLAVALPAFVIIAWLTMSPDGLHETFRAPVPTAGALEPWQRLLGAAANLGSALLLGYGLWRASRCLSRFARGEFFAAEAVRGLRAFACAAFWAVVLGFFETSATSVIISWTNGPGLRELAIGVSSQEVFSALYAAIFWVVAAVMTEAVSLADEHRQFV